LLVPAGAGFQAATVTVWTVDFNNYVEVATAYFLR
jgi:hypothetical protein